MKTLIFSILLVGLIFFIPTASFPCDPPQIINTTSNGGTVFINFQTTATPTLQGFNFYRDDEFLEFLPHTGDTVYIFYFTNQPPGDHNYCITSICNITNHEYPAETIESEPDCEIIGCFYGFNLPFEETWNLSTFSASDWEISSDNWIISADTGNNPPAAVFDPEITLIDYTESLESYYLNAYGMTEGHIFLEYDLSLSSNINSGTEHFLVQVWDHQSESYSTVKDFTNQDGSFGWIRDTIDIRPYSMNKVFRIRFLVQGENTSYIDYWGIDNIRIYRECYPLDITIDSYLLNDTCIVLEMNNNDIRDLIDILIYVYRNEDLIAIYSSVFPMPDPYCVDEPGLYCFYLTAIWESETDQCESNFSEPTCEQVIINSLKDEQINPTITVFFNPDFNILNVESVEPIEKVNIYDTSGRFVFSVSPGNRIFNIDMSHLKPGLYLVGIKSSMLTFTRKLFIN